MIKIIITDESDLIDPDKVDWLGEKAAKYIGIVDVPLIASNNLKSDTRDEINNNVDFWVHAHKVNGKMQVPYTRLAAITDDVTKLIAAIYKLIRKENK